jgi:hypothetical protein
VGIAVGDAFISCWYEKYLYNLLRPETYIQRFIDPTWQPLIGRRRSRSTPRALGPVGRQQRRAGGLFGDGPIVDGPTPPGGSLRGHFDSLTAAFEEAAVSRLYGGIHYPMGIDDGVPEGRCIGQAVVDGVKTRK